MPPAAAKPGMKTYNTTKVLDNFWLITRPEDNAETTAIHWLISRPDWDPKFLSLLDACLVRMTYFGRAESITEIVRVTEGSRSSEVPLCALMSERTATSVPVLTLSPDVTLGQISASTDDPAVGQSTIPPGSRWMFAERPACPRPKPPKRPRKSLPLLTLMQFAIGSRVVPGYRDAVRLTERFRSRVLRCFDRLATGEASDKVKAEAAHLSGKDMDGSALSGHRHAFFSLHGEPDRPQDRPTRLCVWRSKSFTDNEQRAILSAAQKPLHLSFKGDTWPVTLVPLDALVSAPDGFTDRPADAWRTLTSYVPPRHIFDRKGRVKAGCDIRYQIQEELAARGLPLLAQPPEVNKKGWMKVHRPSRRREESTNTNKLGYRVTLKFPIPITGPLLLGNSCHFGLGLFVPV